MTESTSNRILLYLDDDREPWQTGGYIYPVELRPLYLKGKWNIVRNYYQFVEYITNNELPYVISFDHDLGEDEAKALLEQGLSKRIARKHKSTVKSGYDCAVFLKNFCRLNRLKLPIIRVHSLNPVGAERIKQLLQDDDQL